jgi:hypothetical protein
MKWVEHVARMGFMGNANKYVVGKTEGKSPLGRPRRKQEDNVKLNLNKIG